MKEFPKSLLCVSVVLFLVSACANRREPISPRPQEPGTEKDTAIGADQKPYEKDGEIYQYPYSLVAETYDIVLDTLTENFFAEYPDLDAAHTSKMREFIKTEYPRASFVKQLCSHYKSAFDRAATDIPYRETAELEDAINVVMNVAVPIAGGALSTLRGAYVARYVEKDPVRGALFEMEGSQNYTEFISWVQREVPVEELEKNLSFKNGIQDGDRFFFFSAPGPMWEELMGAEGYLHVRDGKIVEGLITTMN